MNTSSISLSPYNLNVRDLFNLRFFCIKSVFTLTLQKIIGLPVGLHIWQLKDIFYANSRPRGHKVWEKIDHMKQILDLDSWKILIFF